MPRQSGTPTEGKRADHSCSAPKREPSSTMSTWHPVTVDPPDGDGGRLVRLHSVAVGRAYGPLGHDRASPARRAGAGLVRRRRASELNRVAWRRPEPVGVLRSRWGTGKGRFDLPRCDGPSQPGIMRLPSRSALMSGLPRLHSGGQMVLQLRRHRRSGRGPVTASATSRSLLSACWDPVTRISHASSGWQASPPAAHPGPCR